MGMRASTIESCQNAAHNTLSLSDTLHGDEEMELLDHIPDERFRPDTAFFEKAMEQTLSDQVIDVVEGLPYPQCAIIKLRFGLETDEMLSIDSTATRLGISMDTVRKQEGRAHNLLRKRLVSVRNYM
jgi:DNA-directed RNA polymerase sigma subunit (sigma70/sigma32)